MKRRRRPPPKFPYRFDCAYAGCVFVVYASSRELADIKIAAQGWKRNPDRCFRCVAKVDQKRTGVLGVRA